MKTLRLLLVLFLAPLASIQAQTLQSKTTATAPASDDWVYLQGATYGIRKLSPNYYISAATAATTYQPLATNLTSWAAISPATKMNKSQVLTLATFVFDGAGSSPVSSTTSLFKLVPAACTITGYTIAGDVSGSCVIDIQKATGSGAFSSIVASAAPALSSASYLDSATLTGWTTVIAAHDRMQARVTSASTLTVITVIVYGTLN